MAGGLRTATGIDADGKTSRYVDAQPNSQLPEGRVAQLGLTMRVCATGRMVMSRRTIVVTPAVRLPGRRPGRLRWADRQPGETPARTLPTPAPLRSPGGGSGHSPNGGSGLPPGGDVPAAAAWEPHREPRAA